MKCYIYILPVWAEGIVWWWSTCLKLFYIYPARLNPGDFLSALANWVLRFLLNLYFFSVLTLFYPSVNFFHFASRVFCQPIHLSMFHLSILADTILWSSKEKNKWVFLLYMFWCLILISRQKRQYSNAFYYDFLKFSSLFYIKRFISYLSPFEARIMSTRHIHIIVNFFIRLFFVSLSVFSQVRT